MAVDETSTADIPVTKRPQIWVAPLVVGCCFALGYGVTHRVLTVEIDVVNPRPARFTPDRFPGDSLQQIRARSDAEYRPLEADIAAIEAAEEMERQSLLQAKQQLEQAKQAELALQTPKPPVWTAPTWSDPALMPALEPVVLPAAAEVVAPADSPVLTADPQPALPAPGAEAFFETVTPENPPQP